MSRTNWTMIVLLQIILYFCGCTVSGNGNLLSTVVLYRHGDRAPIRMYKNDPYAEQVSTIWPEGLGQLTQLGKKQQWALGTWLRERYDGFLPTDYRYEDISVQSSDVDRCLMSAAANLAGLYPPEGVQVWNPSLPWQPIPIHTRPRRDDPYLAVGRRCRKYDDMYDGMMYGGYFLKILEENKELFEYLSVNSGNNISDFDSFRDLYDNLYIEK